MRVAIADPPYIGQSAKHYKNHPDYAGEVDHAELVERLCRDYDAWALCCSSPSLKTILALCPDDVRVMAWVKPFCSFKPGVGVAYAWEPVIVRGGRPRTREQPTIRDWVSANITLERGLVGVKPDEFSFWLFEVLNLNADDQIEDLFPGSSAISRVWESWKRQPRLPEVV